MKRRTIHCKHFRSMMDHETCKAGIAYETMKGMPFDQRPCFARDGNPAPGGCDKAEFPTEAEIAEEDAKFMKIFEQTVVARAAIVSSLGGPWKKGMPSLRGKIDCPVCNGNATLYFSRSGYNGHIHASCTTDGCVAWME